MELVEIPIKIETPEEARRADLIKQAKDLIYNGRIKRVTFLRKWIQDYYESEIQENEI